MKRAKVAKARAKRPATKAQRAAPKRAMAKAAAPKAAAKGAKKASRLGTAGKAEGDAPVRALIAKLPAWQREIAARLDALVGEEVPGVKRAVKWSMPTYGVDGMGWFGFLAPYTKHVSFGFYLGSHLQPPIPAKSSKQMRTVELRNVADVDETLLREWIRQAATRPGWAAPKR